MNVLNGKRIKLVVVGLIAASVLSCGDAKADFIFGEPVNLGTVVNSSRHEAHPCLSSDGLELYFASSRSGGSGQFDIWVCQRQTIDEDWGAPKNLGELVNGPTEDAGPCLSHDGLELYFHSGRPGGFGNFDIWVTRRLTKSDPWGEVENLGQPINSANSEAAPNLSADGLELYFDSTALADAGQAISIHVSKREAKDSTWGEPTSIGATVNSWSYQCCASISTDGLALLFSDFWKEFRPGGIGHADLWLTRRATNESDWSEPINLGQPVNSVSDEVYGAISPDGHNVYFGSGRSGGSGNWDLWQAPIIPIVDFNGDGNIDTSDLVMLIDSWGTDDTLYDIGPMPWGDGVVDVEDLKVFIEHWEQENMSQNQENDQ